MNPAHDTRSEKSGCKIEYMIFFNPANIKNTGRKYTQIFTI